MIKNNYIYPYRTLYFIKMQKKEYSKIFSVVFHCFTLKNIVTIKKYMTTKIPVHVGASFGGR